MPRTLPVDGSATTPPLIPPRLTELICSSRLSPCWIAGMIALMMPEVAWRNWTA